MHEATIFYIAFPRTSRPSAYQLWRLFTHAGGSSTTNTYLVNFILPNNVEIRSLRVCEGILNGQDVLIGMDIIGLGDFSICLKDGKTKFSFQIPSTHDIDFVQEIQQKNISTVQVKKAFDGMITPYGFYNQINMNVLRTKSTDMDVDSIDMKILRI